MQRLPIDPHLPQIQAWIHEGPLVLEAETGAGKTTRVPPALKVEGQIWLVEPRRVAARAAAQRMAQENNWTPGKEVGWHVRFDRNFCSDTQIVCMTEGMFLQRLRQDPFLDGVGAVILDEVHERSTGMDLSLALLNELRSVRQDLCVIAMSATLDGQRLSEWMGAKRLCSEGRTHPVQIEHAARPDSRGVEQRAAEAIRDSLERLEGDILVFLPGMAEIRRCAALLESVPAEIALLHGNLPLAEQNSVLAPSRHRRVVLSTNVAESSVTVPGVRVIVDSGLVRQPQFDPRTGLSPLATVPISQASAKQRAGRAGRVAPGVCIRLWTAADHRDRNEFTTPELLRSNLAGPVLQLRDQGIDPQHFNWFEGPPTSALDAADRLLQDLGATSQGRILPLGQELVKWPVEPRLARLMFETQQLGYRAIGAAAAAYLSVRSPLARGAYGGSLTEQLQALERGEGEPGRLRAWKRVRKQLLRLLDRSPRKRGSASIDAEQALARGVLAAWPERVCHRREVEGPTARMATGQGVRWTHNRQARSFVAIELGPAAADREVHLGCPVLTEWLKTEHRHAHSWDGESVRSEQQTRYRALVLQRHPIPCDPVVAAELLEEHSRNQVGLAQPTTQSWEAWVARLDCLNRSRPQDWPAIDDVLLQSLLPELCVGRRNLTQLRQADWISALWNRLGWNRRTDADRLVPKTYLVPSGRHHPIRYAVGEPPTLSIRIQEMFGLSTTPRIVDETLPLRLELLAPNGRPQQITDDLGGFWAGTWADVRKAMRGRYPKHDWPEDPLTAEPTRRARRRKR